MSNLQNLLTTQPFIYVDYKGLEVNRTALGKDKLRSIMAESEIQVANELQLIDAVEKWVKFTLGTRLKSSLIREEVKHLLPYIRILSLEHEALLEYLKNSILYNDSEKRQIRNAYETGVID